MSDSLGQHLIMELWECNSLIDCPDTIETAIRDAVKGIGATLLNLHVHRFSPQGVTGVATLAESHLALHSWPEHGYLGADVFTCGDQMRPEKLVDVLKQHFEPGWVDVREHARGRRPPCSVSSSLPESSASPIDSSPRN